jgi:hypothetical protein
VDVVVATAAAEKQSAALRDAIGNLASTAGCCSPWHPAGAFCCCSGQPPARFKIRLRWLVARNWRTEERDVPGCVREVDRAHGGHKLDSKSRANSWTDTVTRQLQKKELILLMFYF